MQIIIVFNSCHIKIAIFTLILYSVDQNFKLKNLRDLTYFLGFKITGSHQGINLSQCKYTIDLVNETSMLNSFLVSTPMNFFTKLHADGESLPDPTTYRRLIGKLVYLTNTRLDITYVVNKLNQYISAPTKDHLQIAFKVLRYLKGTVG